MTYKTLISTAQLSKHLEDPQWIILDCRFVLTAPERGEENYLRAHIPGAAYTHLERDLSSTVIPGITGRHPWPGIEQTIETFSHLGIDEHCQVVVYDDAGGALAAVRVWGMLRWLGHEAVAVLNGGWQKWVGEERLVRSGNETHPRREFKARKVNSEWILSADLVQAMCQDSESLVFDVRTHERYLGQNETIDPIAGHIPGALNAPYLENLKSDLTFHSPKWLREHYQTLLGEIPAENVAFYCGSGVTSIFNILAMIHAGLGEAKLYAGSWSEWIAPRTRPIATTEQ